MQPQEDYSMVNVFFFVCFLVLGSLFILNLFVGVIIMTFYEEKEKLSKNSLLTSI